MTKTNWTVTPGRVYVTKDGQYMVKNIGPRMWGLYVNDGTQDWDIDWVGSCFPTAKSAMDSIKAGA